MHIRVPSNQLIDFDGSNSSRVSENKIILVLRVDDKQGLKRMNLILPMDYTK